MTNPSQSSRERTLREAIAELEDWVLTHDRDPDLAPNAERFLIEYVILNAHDPSVRQMWNDYTHSKAATYAAEMEA